MALLFLCYNIVLLISVFYFRYPNTILPYVLPFPLNGLILTCLWGILLIVSLFFLWNNRRDINWKRVAHIYTELTALSLLFSYLWGRVPFDKNRVIDVSIGVCLLLLLVWLGFRNFRDDTFSGLTRLNFLPALKLLFLPTILAISISVIWFLMVSDDNIIMSHFIVSFVSYPVYAFFQLLLFIEFPLKRFQQLSRSKVEIVFVLAAFFGLIHWPNYILVLGTFVIMLIWASIYLRYPNIWATSLAFGIPATFAIQFLPNNITNGVRIGPKYVNERVKKSQSGSLFNRVHGTFEIESPFIDGKKKFNSTDFSEKLYTKVLQKEPHAYRIKLWSNIRKILGSESTLMAFLMSSEIKSAEWYHNGEQPEDHLNEYRGYLDEAFHTEEDMIRLRGWAANTTIDMIAKKLLVFVNGTLILEKEPNIFRPDLRDSLKKSGFQFDIQLDKPQHPKDNEIRIFALFKDNILAELQYPNQYQWLIK